MPRTRSADRGQITTPEQDGIFSTPGTASAINMATITTQVAATTNLLHSSAGHFVDMQNALQLQNEQISELTNSLNVISRTLTQNASIVPERKTSDNSANFFAKPSIDTFINKVNILDVSNPEKIIKFISDTQHLIDIDFLPQEILKKALINRCASNAHNFWSDCIAQTLTWSQIKNKLLEIYVSPLTKQLLLDKLVRRSQLENEKFSTFTSDIINFAKILSPELPEAQIIEIIFAHANNAVLTVMGLNSIPSNYTDLYKLVSKIEEIQGRISLPIAHTSRVHDSNTKANNKYFCNYCKSNTHTIQYCRKRKYNSSNNQFKDNNPKN